MLRPATRSSKNPPPAPTLCHATELHQYCGEHLVCTAIKAELFGHLTSGQPILEQLASVSYSSCESAHQQFGSIDTVLTAD